MNSYSKYRILVTAAAVVAIVALIVAKLQSFDSVIQNAIRPVFVTTSAMSKKPTPKPILEPTSDATKTQLPQGFSYNNIKKNGQPYLVNPCAPIEYSIADPPSPTESENLVKAINTTGSFTGITFKLVPELSKQRFKPLTTQLQFKFIDDESMKKKTEEDNIVSIAETLDASDNRNDIATFYNRSSNISSTYIQQNPGTEASSEYFTAILIALGLKDTDSLDTLSYNLVKNTPTDTDKQALNALVRTCPA
ncbi:hypothetical protein [Bifidobacterium sp. ESL0745]|uniref:hypothetical protein n=1 Tax=Bifidobacterium sp. ESL0745 TaxID=2983226 RepID=UPI0023F7417B|nr:hypothetical protein [Bifidobacterium sp. ESL0745]MDF7665523.1 hypothetical protein [Bifidobacterium sp. ESL0745]